MESSIINNLVNMDQHNTEEVTELIENPTSLRCVVDFSDELALYFNLLSSTTRYIGTTRTQLYLFQFLVEYYLVLRSDYGDAIVNIETEELAVMVSGVIYQIDETVSEEEVYFFIYEEIINIDNLLILLFKKINKRLVVIDTWDIRDSAIFATCKIDGD